MSMIKDFENMLADIKEESIIQEKYLGMMDVDKSDLGVYFRRRLSMALKTNIDSQLESERILNPNETKLARMVLGKLKDDHEFLYILHGSTFKDKNGKTVSSHAKDAEKTEVTIALTNAYYLAKRVDPEISMAPSVFIYAISNFTHDGEDIVIDKVSGTLSGVVGFIKDKIKLGLHVYALTAKGDSDPTTLIKDPVSREKKKKDTAAKEKKE